MTLALRLGCVSLADPLQLVKGSALTGQNWMELQLADHLASGWTSWVQSPPCGPLLMQRRKKLKLTLTLLLMPKLLPCR